MDRGTYELGTPGGICLLLKYPVTVLDPGADRFYRTVDFEGPPEQLADKIPVINKGWSRS